MKHYHHHQGRLSLVVARRRARVSSRAFLLLETVLAVLVMAMALFAILEGVNRCVAATVSIRNHSIVSTLLSNKSYELRTEMADNVDDLAEEFGDVPGFRWERRFEETADTQENKIWIQRLTVYWQERGREAAETLTEYRYLPDKQF